MQPVTHVLTLLSLNTVQQTRDESGTPSCVKTTSLTVGLGTGLGLVGVVRWGRWYFGVKTLQTQDISLISVLKTFQHPCRILWRYWLMVFLHRPSV